MSREVEGAYGCRLWKFIRKGFADFKNCIRFDIGNGRRVKFWRDGWSSDTPLNMRFPNLFAIAEGKDDFINQCGEWEGGRMVWTPLFRRNLQDWELEEVFNLLRHLQKFSISVERSDELVWIMGNTRVFSVKSFFMVLESKGLKDFPWRSILGDGDPEKSGFLCLASGVGCSSHH
uniref:Reverse transcriptase zinc-binding domain-containing protein n=1 Tax=Davidia involucrata TaxID=16924 RepID=A0A5B7BKK6_DAVIN